MKLHSLPLMGFIVLGAAAAAHAQAATPPPPAKKAPPAEPADPFGTTGPYSAPEQNRKWRMSGDGVLHLPDGTLPDVVSQVELAVSEMVGPNSEKGTMPNIVFGPGTESARVPTPLSLREVSPVQALALVAAAAGCTLEPINAPPEGSDAYSLVIGYRFMLAPAMGFGSATSSFTVNKPGDLVTIMKNPNSAASASKKDAGRQSQQAGTTIIHGTSSKSATDPAAPKAGYDAGGNPASGVDSRRGGVFGEGGFGGGFGTIYSVGPSTPPASNEPVVRVYALGAIMGDRDLEGQKLDQKQKEIEMLISEALERGSFGKVAPELSFHRGTKALIVKGTPAQQELVAQVIDVIRDNEGLRPVGK